MIVFTLKHAARRLCLGGASIVIFNPNLTWGLLSMLSSQPYRQNPPRVFRCAYNARYGLGEGGGYGLQINTIDLIAQPHFIENSCHDAWNLSMIRASTFSFDLCRITMHIQSWRVRSYEAPQFYWDMGVSIRHTIDRVSPPKPPWAWVETGLGRSMPAALPELSGTAMKSCHVEPQLMRHHYVRRGLLSFMLPWLVQGWLGPDLSTLRFRGHRNCMCEVATWWDGRCLTFYFPLGDRERWFACDTRMSRFTRDTLSAAKWCPARQFKLLG